MSQRRIHHARIMKSLKYQAGFKEQYASFLDRVRIIVSSLIWQQSWVPETERVMREKKGGRWRCGGKERRREEGRHAWASCGRCLKMMRTRCHISQRGLRFFTLFLSFNSLYCFDSFPLIISFTYFPFPYFSFTFFSIIYIFFPDCFHFPRRTFPFLSPFFPR